MSTDVVTNQTLSRIQEWFLSAITDPDGVRSGVSSVADAEAVLTRSEALPALD